MRSVELAVVRGVVAGMVGLELAPAVSEALGAHGGWTRDRRKGRPSLRDLARKHRLAPETLRAAVLRAQQGLAGLVRWAVLGDNPGAGAGVGGAGPSVMARARERDELLALYEAWRGEGWPEAILERLERMRAAAVVATIGAEEAAKIGLQV